MQKMEILLCCCRDTYKIHLRSKSTRDQNSPSQIREPLTDRGLGVKMIVKNE